MLLDKLCRPICIGDTVVFPTFNQHGNILLQQGKITELDEATVLIGTEHANSRQSIKEIVVVTSQLSVNMQEYPENFL